MRAGKLKHLASHEKSLSAVIVILMRASKEAQHTDAIQIVVEKLTKNVTESHLREIFGAYGPLRDLDMPINRQCTTHPISLSLSVTSIKANLPLFPLVNTNRGTAYILYTTAPSAESAIAHMHEAQIDGAIISVSIVLPRRKFSRSPPPAASTRHSRIPPPHSNNFDRYEPRGGPPPSYRGPPPGAGGGRYRSPPPMRRGSPPPRRGYGRPDPRDRGGNFDTYRPRSYSRSRSPRSRSYSSRSRSPPPRRRGGGGRRDSPPRGGGRRRRSPSYSSYSSYSDRSRSRSRGRGGRGRR
ncbi:MAG: hypothetical protein M1835_003501 [Candelina submexicana]|nr:MAG: hypothetical protein M1835_003501 [Candelina submexicana]